jgi:hypothetical protein
MSGKAGSGAGVQPATIRRKLQLLPRRPGDAKNMAVTNVEYIAVCSTKEAA